MWRSVTWMVRGVHVKVCIYGRRKCIMNRDKIPMGKIAFDDTDWRAGALL